MPKPLNFSSELTSAYFRNGEPVSFSDHRMANVL